MTDHVCRYLELSDDGTYFCGGCHKSYQLAPAGEVERLQGLLARADEFLTGYTHVMGFVDEAKSMMDLDGKEVSALIYEIRGR